VEFERGLPGDDGLDEQDERVDGVAEAVEDEDWFAMLGLGRRVGGGRGMGYVRFH
jgi:hypothetical protein